MEVLNDQTERKEGIMERPQNNMVWAIIGTILGLCSPCCIGLVLGIIALVMSSQVNNKYDNGDVAGAVRDAKNAKILALIALGLFLLNVAYVVISIMVKGVDVYMEEYRAIFESFSNL